LQNFASNCLQTVIIFFYLSYRALPCEVILCRAFLLTQLSSYAVCQWGTSRRYAPPRSRSKKNSQKIYCSLTYFAKLQGTVGTLLFDARWNCYSLTDLLKGLPYLKTGTVITHKNTESLSCRRPNSFTLKGDSPKFRKEQIRKRFLAGFKTR
jgi:hypothetical protein